MFVTRFPRQSLERKAYEENGQKNQWYSIEKKKNQKKTKTEPNDEEPER